MICRRLVLCLLSLYRWPSWSIVEWLAVTPLFRTSSRQGWSWWVPWNLLQIHPNLLVCMCKYHYWQIASTGTGTAISSNGTITGSGKSHFWYCIYCSFFSFSCLIAHSVTDQCPLSKILVQEKRPSTISKIRKAVWCPRERKFRTNEHTIRYLNFRVWCEPI